MKNSIKSSVFQTAWNLFNSNIYPTFGAALSAAWKEVKLRVALKATKVEITFRKATGEITTRIATLSSDFFSYSGQSWAKAPKSGLIKFFSLTDNAFRACRIERLISFKAVA